MYMDNNINFTGGFLIRNVANSTILDKVYDEIVPKKRIILQDLFEKGDFFFASKSCYDKEISEYLIKRGFKFFYYPELNLKSRLSAWEMDKAIEKINSSSVITDEDEIVKQASKFEINHAPMRYRWKENDHIQQTINALKRLSNSDTSPIQFDEKNVLISTNNHLTVIKSKDGKLIAKVSPNNDKGISYAMIYPKYGDEHMLFMSTNYKGEIFSPTKDIDNLKEFMKKFRNAMKVDASRKRPNKES